MNQSKLESLVEAGINIATGLIIAITLTQLLQGTLGYTMPPDANLKLSIVLTIVSIIRSYFWRRFFNAGIYKGVQALVDKVVRG